LERERLWREQDAEVVLLGGTDLFLAFRGRDVGFPMLDRVDVHVEAVYQASLRPAAGATHQNIWQPEIYFTRCKDFVERSGHAKGDQVNHPIPPAFDSRDAA
jgi:hypothetical protein